jgi:hypothetical protein
MSKINNLKLWNDVCKTDPKYTKKVGFGSHKFTTIDAQYQMRMATEQWGSYGSAWGLKNISYEMLTLDKGQVMALVSGDFFYPDGTFPISSTIWVQSTVKKTGELRGDDEWAKKVHTDITTKALSKLGYNADVFLGLYDDNKYVLKMTEEFTAEKDKPKLSTAQFTAMAKFIEDGNASVVKERLRKYQLTKKQQENIDKLIMVAENIS